MNRKYINTKRCTKVYVTEDSQTLAVNKVSFEIPKSSFVGIMGILVQVKLPCLI